MSVVELAVIMVCNCGGGTACGWRTACEGGTAGGGAGEGIYPGADPPPVETAVAVLKAWAWACARD